MVQAAKTAQTAKKPIRTRAAVQYVILSISAQLVVVIAAPKVIFACATDQNITTGPARKAIMARIAVDLIRTDCAGEVIVGANIFKDLFAGIRDIVGGRSGSYESTLRDARATALEELKMEAKALGADAVIGVDLDYETLGQGGTMLMVTASGTAVKLG